MPDKRQKNGLKEQRIREVMEQTGWTHDFAAKQMEDAGKRLGVNYKEYLTYGLFRVPVEKQKQKYEEAVLQKRQKAKEKQERSVAKVMEATGWDYDFTRNKIEEARERTGCTYNEYLIYKFYELDEAGQSEVFVIQESKKITARYNVDKKFVNILYNKELSNLYFSEYLKRPWCVNTKISYDAFFKKFADSKKVFYKPLDGHHGNDAEAFDINGCNIREVFSRLVSYPEGVVEQYISQHHRMDALASSAVNTVRIVSVSSNTRPVTPDGANIDIAYASLKMGGAHSVVDNLAGGGLVAGVDLKTGELITDAVDEEGNVFSTHPETGTTIKGFQIPFFAEALALVADVYEKKKFEGYLGWDIAVTEEGPAVVEVNTVPGVILFQLPYVAEKKGMKHVMEKYLS